MKHPCLPIASSPGPLSLVSGVCGYGTVSPCQHLKTGLGGIAEFLKQALFGVLGTRHAQGGVVGLSSVVGCHDLHCFGFDNYIICRSTHSLQSVSLQIGEEIQQERIS